jgi:glucoamylase
MAVKNSFGALYTVNKQHRQLAPGIGRYPEDMYNGYNSDIGGNPWMLLTAAMAEVCYRTRNIWNKAGTFKITKRNASFLTYVNGNKITFKAGETISAKDKRFQSTLKGLLSVGDAYLQRVRLATEKDDMHLSEQWNRETGKQQGAEHLTWSYVSFITAYNARKGAL